MGFGVEVPWANMESDVCKYMDCDAKPDADGTLTFTYPIDILDLYPSVSSYLLLITLAYTRKHNSRLAQILGHSKINYEVDVVFSSSAHKNSTSHRAKNWIPMKISQGMLR